MWRSWSPNPKKVGTWWSLQLDVIHREAIALKMLSSKIRWSPDCALSTKICQQWFCWQPLAIGVLPTSTQVKRSETKSRYFWLAYEIQRAEGSARKIFCLVRGLFHEDTKTHMKVALRADCKLLVQTLERLKEDEQFFNESIRKGSDSLKTGRFALQELHYWITISNDLKGNFEVQPWDHLLTPVLSWALYSFPENPLENKGFQKPRKRPSLLWGWSGHHRLWHFVWHDQHTTPGQGLFRLATVDWLAMCWV